MGVCLDCVSSHACALVQQGRPVTCVTLRPPSDHPLQHRPELQFGAHDSELLPSTLRAPSEHPSSTLRAPSEHPPSTLRAPSEHPSSKTLLCIDASRARRRCQRNSSPSSSRASARCAARARHSAQPPQAPFRAHRCCRWAVAMSMPSARRARAPTYARPQCARGGARYRLPFFHSGALSPLPPAHSQVLAELEARRVPRCPRAAECRAELGAEVVQRALATALGGKAREARRLEPSRYPTDLPLAFHRRSRRGCLIGTTRARRPRRSAIRCAGRAAPPTARATSSYLARCSAR